MPREVVYVDGACVRLMAQLAHGFERRPDVRTGLTAPGVGLGMGAALLRESRRHG